MREAIPDRDLMLERSALCGLFYERTAFSALSDLGLTAAHFVSPAHRFVFGAIRACLDDALYADGVLPLLLLERRLADQHRLDDAGGLPYLVDLFEYVPSPAAMPHYVRELDKLLERRRAVQELTEAVDLARSGDLDAARHIASKAAATPAGRDVLKSSALQVEDLAQDLVDETKPDSSSVSTGFPRLDRLIGGFIPGRSYVLAGMTSVGKSALALQLVIAFANYGGRVHVWSQEMHHKDCRRRMAAMLAGIPLPRGALKGLTEGQQERLDGALKLLRDLPIDIDDRASTLPMMIDQARALRGRVGLFVVDHAQIVTVPGADTEYQAISAVSRTCKKHFAVECEAACLLLSQFSREAAREKSPKPHQLRGSGALEQDTNVGMTLTREAYMQRSSNDPSASLTVWKNRDGKCGTVPLEWDRRLVRFIEPLQTETRYAGEEDE